MRTDSSRAPRTICTQVADERLEQIRFASDLAAVGALRCPVDSSYFRGEQVTNNFVVAFPRAALWIAHEQGPPFVAAATLATIYNRGQRFARHPIAPDGDTADWFAVSEDIVRDIVAAFDPDAAQSEMPLRFSRVDVPPGLYLAQRRVCNIVNTEDRLASEERVIGIVHRVLHAAYHRRRASRPAAARPRDRARRDLVEQAKAVVTTERFAHAGLSEIAAACGVSPYHLSRTFRALTGESLFGFRRDLRLRTALALLPHHRGRLSELAHALGFSSHAHFTHAFRRHFGLRPAQNDCTTA